MDPLALAHLLSGHLSSSRSTISATWRGRLARLRPSPTPTLAGLTSSQKAKAGGETALTLITQTRCFTPGLGGQVAHETTSHTQLPLSS